MEHMNNLLSRLLRRQDFRKRYEQLKQQVLSHREVQAFLREHKEKITEDVLDRSLVKLYEFMEQTTNCKRCPSLEMCQNLLKGYQPRLVWQGHAIDVQYDRCPTKVKHDDRKRQEALIQSLFVPREILQASLSDVDLTDEGRMKAIELAETFVSTYEPGKKMKGLYLYGSFGVGKTYILGAIANALAKKKYCVPYRLCARIFPRAKKFAARPDD